MTNPNTQDLLSLAERVEKAVGPDRELDCAIWLFTRGITLRKFMSHSNRDGRRAQAAIRFARTDQGDISVMASPTYTASIDSAMTLVPEGWSLKLYAHPEPECHAEVYKLGAITHLNDGSLMRPYAAGGAPCEAGPCVTAALAITAASLRSHAVEGRDG